MNDFSKIHISSILNTTYACFEFQLNHRSTFQIASFNNYHAVFLLVPPLVHFAFTVFLFK